MLLVSMALQKLQKYPSQHGKGQWKSSAALGSLSALLQSSCCLSLNMSLKVFTPLVHGASQQSAGFL